MSSELSLGPEIPAMRIVKEPLPGLKLIEPKLFADARGEFVKTYHVDLFASCGIPFVPAEEFFSTSVRGVVRGMHFQLPPHAHDKLVYCIRGRVLDVVLDLRRSSPTYGRVESCELSQYNHFQLFVPAGCAHGFLSLEDNSTLVYQTSTTHHSSQDAGVRWDSIGFSWPVTNPTVSVRDAGLPALGHFVSPF